jgi:hypothetical protein
MVNGLVGGLTLLAIFLAFVNMGTPLGLIFAIVSTLGLIFGIRSLRARLRGSAP